MSKRQITVTLTREEAKALGAFADAFRALAKENPQLQGHEALPHMEAAASKLHFELVKGGEGS